MFRKQLVLFVFTLLFLSACSSETFIFTGETENWSTELKVIQHGNGYENQEFKLLFKGDPSTVDNVNFNVETNATGFGGSDYELNGKGEILVSDEANPTNAKITDDSEVEVTVEWNDKTETIILDN
ncbi:hypothetical protein [Oceanobacillus sp. FSL H7-0719]|uniref:hypothetical protein n=1 Tax=Oceanobacillus sp. FSL H7-0719 TaxID=2954507 RepID=UPI003247083D